MVHAIFRARYVFGCTPSKFVYLGKEAAGEGKAAGGRGNSKVKGNNRKTIIYWRHADANVRYDRKATSDNNIAVSGFAEGEGINSGSRQHPPDRQIRYSAIDNTGPRYSLVTSLQQPVKRSRLEERRGPAPNLHLLPAIHSHA